MLGTSAEEGGNGKGLVLDAGAMNDVDFSMMAHPCPFDFIYVNNFVCAQE